MSFFFFGFCRPVYPSVMAQYYLKNFWHNRLRARLLPSITTSPTPTWSFFSHTISSPSVSSLPNRYLELQERTTACWMGGENLAICKATWRRGFIFVTLYHFVIYIVHIIINIIVIPSPLEQWEPAGEVIWCSDCPHMESSKQAQWVWWWLWRVWRFWWWWLLDDHYLN